MIIGYIANDRMFIVLDRFISGEITLEDMSGLQKEKRSVESPAQIRR